MKKHATKRHVKHVKNVKNLEQVKHVERHCNKPLKNCDCRLPSLSFWAHPATSLACLWPPLTTQTSCFWPRSLSNFAPGAFCTSGFPSGRLFRRLGDGDHYPWYQWSSLGLLTVMIFGKWKVAFVVFGPMCIIRRFRTNVHHSLF